MFLCKNLPELQIYLACSYSYTPTPYGGRWAAEYVSTHPYFVDVFPVETMKSPYMIAIECYDLLPNRTWGSFGPTFYISLLSFSGLRPYNVRPCRADLYHSDVRMRLPNPGMVIKHILVPLWKLGRFRCP